MEVQKTFSNPKNIFSDQEFNSNDSSSNSSSQNDSDMSEDEETEEILQINNSQSKYTENSKYSSSRHTASHRKSALDQEAQIKRGNLGKKPKEVKKNLIKSTTSNLNYLKKRIMGGMGSPKSKRRQYNDVSVNMKLEIQSMISPQKNKEVKAKVNSGLRYRKNQLKTLTKVKSARRLLGATSPEKLLQNSRLGRKQSTAVNDSVKYYNDMQDSFFRTYDFEHLNQKRASLACVDKDLSHRACKRSTCNANTSIPKYRLPHHKSPKKLLKLDYNKIKIVPISSNSIKDKGRSKSRMKKRNLKNTVYNNILDDKKGSSHKTKGLLVTPKKLDLKSKTDKLKLKEIVLSDSDSKSRKSKRNKSKSKPSKQTGKKNKSKKKKKDLEIFNEVNSKLKKIQDEQSSGPKQDKVKIKEDMRIRFAKMNNLGSELITTTTHRKGSAYSKSKKKRKKPTPQKNFNKFAQMSLHTKPEISRTKFTQRKTKQKIIDGSRPRKINRRSKSIQKVKFTSTNLRVKPNYQNYTSQFKADLENGKESDRTTSTANESLNLVQGPKSNSFYGLIFNPELAGVNLNKKAYQFVDQMIHNMRDFDNKFPKGIDFPHRTVNLPTRKANKNKKTIVFDLDETLIHCCFDKNRDVSKCIKIPLKDSSKKKLDEAHLFLRPYAKEIVEELSKVYEILVFTSSQREYAREVVRVLDPKRKFITFTLSREHCNVQKSLMIKDLRVIANRNLDNMVIIDNCIGGYANHIRNGIPIFPYEGEDEDNELLYLKDYLLDLSKQEGCFADNNLKGFKLQELRWYSNPNEYIADARVKN